MPIYPSTPSELNYTIGLPTAIYFDDGTGERHLGNVVAAKITPVVEDVPHFASVGGTRQTDATTSRLERFVIEGTFDEPDVHNLSALLLGGAIADSDGGTVQVNDKAVNLAGTQWSSLGFPQVSDVVVSTMPDRMLRDPDGTGQSYYDHTTVARGGGGTPFTLLQDADDDLFIGSERPFGRIFFNIQTPASGCAFTVKYFDGVAWTNVANLADGTAGLTLDGDVSWDLPANWQRTTVNGSHLYWVKMEAVAVTSAATCADMVLTYVEDRDYSVDPPGGKLRRLSNSSITDGARAYVDFKYAAPSGKTFAPGVTLRRSGTARLVFEPQVGAGFEYRAWKAAIKPGAFVFNAEDWVDFPLQIEVLADPVGHPDSPFGEITYTGVEE